jgi:hypothetical protein
MGGLAWLGDPNGSIQVTADRVSGMRGVTFGDMSLCVSGGGTATIVAVEPIATLGGPVESMTLIRKAPQGDVVISAPGFPAQGLRGTVSEATGATVNVACDESGVAPIDEPRTELMVALQPSTDVGGGWAGIELTYSRDGSVYTLLMKSVLVVCDEGSVGGCGALAEQGAVGLEGVMGGT